MKQQIFEKEMHKNNTDFKMRHLKDIMSKNI